MPHHVRRLQGSEGFVRRPKGKAQAPGARAAATLASPRGRRAGRKRRSPGPRPPSPARSVDLARAPGEGPLPESYGVDRVRLLVKDPEWLFAYWELGPRPLAELRRRMGERVAALSRLTLRVEDERGVNNAVLLPPGARAWYVRGPVGISCRAVLGYTLPSGEFHPVVVSAPVAMPEPGPSETPARAVVSYATLAGPGPLPPELATAGAEAATTRAAEAGAEEEPRGGASDVNRPRAPEEAAERGGASDVHRR